MGRSNRRLDAAATFGKRVRARRTELELSQIALSERSGLHFTYLSSLERGERNVSLENIVRLAAALEIDAGDLVQGLSPTPVDVSRRSS